MSRFFSWEYYCSLFPKKSEEIIDPKEWRCSCGYRFKFSRWQLLRLYLQDKYVFTCPQCLRKSTYRMITHVVRDIDSDEIKDNNRWLK